MFAVLEEIEENVAILIPDSDGHPLYIPLSQIPRPFSVGDVFRVDYTTQSQVILNKDEKETEKRKAKNRSKRERLLKRTKKRNE